MLQHTMKNLILIPVFLMISLGAFAHDIFTAVKADDLAAVKYLLHKGVDPNYVNSKGETPLIVAALNNNSRMGDFLVEMDADINAQDAAGNSALMYAVKSKNLDLVRMLVKHGAMVHQTNQAGQSAVDFARQQHDADMLQLVDQQNQITE